MPTTFLFWNIAKQRLEDRVAHLCSEWNVDVLMLAECPGDTDFDDALRKCLTFNTGSSFESVGITRGKVQFYSRIESGSWTDLRSTATGSLSLQELRFREGPLILGGIHFPSKAGFSQSDQLAEATRLAFEVRLIESQRGHERTLLMGDFNMDPFDHGMVSSHGFHAVMTRDLARSEGRIVQGRSYSQFYNPMWGLLGDQTRGSPGTFPFDASGLPVNYFWHIFDQMLIRPAILPYFGTEFGAIETIGGEPILRRGSARNTIASSDHLPVFIRLNLTMEG
jgi:hypothetical protein